MSIAALIRRMADAGASPEAIAIAVEAIEEEQAKDAERRAKNAERKARQRAGQSRDSHATVTGRGEDNTSPKKETSPTPPKEKTTPSSSGDKSPSRCESDFFEDFWIVFPRREGSNPKKPARDRFNRLVAKGHDPQAIIEAARALSAEHPTPTRFVPQAITWLNQERFADTEPVVPGELFCSEDMPNTRLHVLRFRNENSGADPPRAVQGGKAGYLIPAQWVKSMELRQANG